MFTDTDTITISSHEEARALLERAKALRAREMRRLLRAAWARITARRPAAVPARPTTGGTANA